MAASTENQKVSEIFDHLWKKYNDVQSSDEPSTSDKLQKDVTEAIETCEKLIHIINGLQLFSDNETIDEVATNEIRFLLLSALLAYLTNKSLKDERYDTVKKCQVYYTDFLKLCKNYGLTDVKIPEVSTNENGELETANKKRTRDSNDRQALESKRKAKIQRFKEQKATELKLHELYPVVQQEHVDDEVKREYYLTLVNQWIGIAFDDLESLDSELPILEHMAKMKLDSGASGNSQPPPAPISSQNTRKPMRPFIITKSDLQKQVFGLGYPSIPTYTLDEFYDAQVAKGQLPDQGHQQSLQGASNDPDAERKEQEKREREKEEKEENDDEETLNKAREWDEWKDDHRRGWGNTHNKG